LPIGGDAGIVYAYSNTHTAEFCWLHVGATAVIGWLVTIDPLAGSSSVIVALEMSNEPNGSLMLARRYTIAPG
jgi:hypothetical protein